MEHSSYHLRNIVVKAPLAQASPFWGQQQAAWMRISTPADLDVAHKRLQNAPIFTSMYV